MNRMVKVSADKLPVWVIVLVSVTVPALVAVLYFSSGKLELGGFVYTLPHFHAGVNSATCLVLVAALVAIRNGKVELHQMFMTSALVMGALFLLSYVIYHSSVESVIYGDTNHNGLLEDAEREAATNRGLYLVILLSHIALSMLALPLVLLAYFAAWKKNFIRHKKLVRWAFPIWLYVSVTGVIVYWMIRPFYI